METLTCEDCSSFDSDAEVCLNSVRPSATGLLVTLYSRASATDPACSEYIDR